jgi:hypothetical protein
MIRIFSTKSLIASAIALGAVMAGSAAHARTDVTLVVGLNSPQLQNVQFRHDQDRFDRRGGTLGDADRDGIPNRFDRDSRFYDARATQRHAQWGDFDRDGVVNHFDRAPRNPRRS